MPIWVTTSFFAELRALPEHPPRPRGSAAVLPVPQRIPSRATREYQRIGLAERFTPPSRRNWTAPEGAGPTLAGRFGRNGSSFSRNLVPQLEQGPCHPPRLRSFPHCTSPSPGGSSEERCSHRHRHIGSAAPWCSYRFASRSGWAAPQPSELRPASLCERHPRIRREGSRNAQCLRSPVTRTAQPREKNRAGTTRLDAFSRADDEKEGPRGTSRGVRKMGRSGTMRRASSRPPDPEAGIPGRECQRSWRTLSRSRKKSPPRP